MNHLLRGVRLADGAVTTVAGTGGQWRMDNGTTAALDVDLSSPWDLAWFEGALVIAMAGIHQLWSFDPVARTAGVYAGTTVESLKDGPLDQVWMAQPSGLAAAGDRLWLVDSETSALRYVESGRMHTAVGQGLFDFGHVDGPAADALMQHPLGLAVLPDGRIAVADTYNGALRAYDPRTETVSTLAADLAEPSDVIVLGEQVIVVESAAHRLVAPDLDEAAVAGQHHRVTRKRTKVAPGALRLEVLFEPAAGQKLDYTYGSPIQVTVSADPPQLLAEGAGKGEELGRDLVLGEASRRASCRWSRRRPRATPRPSTPRATSPARTGACRSRSPRTASPPSGWCCVPDPRRCDLLCEHVFRPPSACHESVQVSLRITLFGSHDVRKYGLSGRKPL